MRRNWFVRLALFGLLIFVGAYIYADQAGITVLGAVLLPVTAIFALIVAFVSLAPERHKYQFYLSQNPTAKSVDRRARMLMYVGVGLLILGPGSLSLPLFAPARLHSAAPILIMGSLLSICIGLALVNYRLVVWWIGYFSNVYRHR